MNDQHDNAITDAEMLDKLTSTTCINTVLLEHMINFIYIVSVESLTLASHLPKELADEFCNWSDKAGALLEVIHVEGLHED